MDSGAYTLTSPRSSVSRCGLYIAVVSGSQLQIHSLRKKSAQTESFPLVFQLNQIVANHRRANGYSPGEKPVSVLQIEWELVNSEPSSKVAVAVTDESLTLTVVLDFVGSEPVIIEADSMGIERIQWIPSPEPKVGSYVNSTIIAVFSKLGVSLKIYSLLNTHLLFTVAKPLGSHIIAHPTNNSIWSIVASPYYAKNSPARSIGSDQSSSWPVLLHFVTDGESCSLLASLKLKVNPSDTAKFSWSASGRWLQYFDTGNCLSGYNLALFNLLGIHNKPVEDIRSHTASASITYSSRPDPAETTNVEDQVSAWGALDSTDYIITFPSEMQSSVEVQTYDVNHLLRSKPQKLALTSGKLWLASQDPNHKVKYRSIGQVPGTKSLQWTKTFAFGNNHIVNYDRCVVAIKTERDPHIKASVLFTIFASVKFLDAFPLPEDSFLLAFTDHVAVRTQRTISVIATSRYTFSEVTFTEQGSSIIVTMVEESPSGPIWRQVEHTTSQKRALSPAPPREAGESTATLINRMRVGLENTEEPTDTFQGLSKRRRANPV